MQKLKYKQLKNYDDHQEMNENNSNRKKIIDIVQEYKRYWSIKVLFCFVLAIFLINRFGSENDKAENYNKTDLILKNTVNLNGTTSDKTFFIIEEKNFKKLNNCLAMSSLYNNCNIDTRNAINNIITLTTVAAENDFQTITNTMTSKLDGSTKQNTIKDNNYDNVDITTIKIIVDSKKHSNAGVINANSFDIDKTSVKQSSNNKLLPTIEITTDLTTDNTDTTTITPMKAISESGRTTPVKYSPAVEQKYFINTTHCHIPFVEPFTPEIRKIFEPQHYTGCTKDKPIVTSSFNEFETKYILHINYSVAGNLKGSTKKAKSMEEDLLCCYKQIIRSGSGKKVDASFKLLPCTNFHQNFVVPKHINAIIVYCKLKSMKSTLQEDFFSFVQINKTRLQQQHSQNTTITVRKASILMIGIDTLSRINFRRNMPEMYKYLVDNSWYELMGYNKVGDNTLPNLMPLLSGYTRKTVYKNCHPQTVGGFDNCNFIWDTFKKNGYYTAYAEDSSSLATFNYHLKGFSKPPTDYYFRPMALAIEKTMKRKVKAGLNYCLGRKQFGEYIYDYATQFAVRFKNQPSFGFFWTNSFSHNSYDVSATMEKTMVTYFKVWENQGIFENSIVMFFSDHGVRWGPLLKLSQGFLEERLPMFFISVPKWFRHEYPELMRNLEINQKRLTNPFDIHMTLQHLLKLTDHNFKIQQTFDCRQCQSIFEELPEKRTCDDASIPEAWCTCTPFKKESTKSKVVQTVGKLIIQEMNEYFKRKNLTYVCSPLELEEITNAKWRSSDDSKLLNTITTYVIDFTVKPITHPKTLFSANVDYNEESKSIRLNVEDISRQSLYEKTAKCMDDAQAKKYCICKNSLK